jgi:metal-responsive CopG/Arc/MetJ family transcriptional regulator
MRTTVDLPDDLYRTLKARAGLNGVPLSELVRRLIEQGLHSAAAPESGSRKKFGSPPVIIPARGKPIPATARADLVRMEEEDDEAKHARSA